MQRSSVSNRLARFAAALACCACLAPAGALAQGAAPKAPATMTDISIGAIALSSSVYWDILVARDQGFLKAQGLNAKFAEVGQQADLIAALTAGSVQFITLTVDPQVLAIKAGAPDVIIAASGFANLGVVTKPNIASYADLRGKKVAVSDPTVSSTLLMLNLFEKHGLSRKDVQLIPSGSGTDRLNMLLAGQVDASLLAQPQDFIAVSKGMKALGYTIEATGEYAFNSYGVNKEYAKKNPEVVKAFIRAIRDSQQWLYDPANRERAIEILAKETKFPKEIVAKTYDFALKDNQLIVRNARFNDAAVENTLRALNQQTGKGPYKQSDAFDWSYWQEAVGK